MLQSCHGFCKFRTGTMITGLCGTLIMLGAGIFSDRDESKHKRSDNIIFYTYLHAVINALLIYGAIEESKYCLVPWLASQAFILIIVTMEGFVIMLSQPFSLLYFAFLEFWYIWVCVLSYYNELDQPKTIVTTVGKHPSKIQPNTVTSASTNESRKSPSYAKEGKYPVRV